MNYVDGYVIAVPIANKQKYIEFSRKSAKIFKEFGALQVVECWGDDVPEGKVTDFQRAVKAQEDEVVVFAWTIWPDKETRNAATAKMMEDPQMSGMFEEMPLDGKRMIYGGFQQIVSE